MMKKRMACSIGCMLLAAGCGEPLTDSSIDTGTPVVESFLQEGTNSLTVKVYSMEVYLKDDYLLSKPIEGLLIKINDRALAETSEGVYSLDLGMDTIREKQAFRLQFDYNEKRIEASTTIPAPVQNLKSEPEYLTLSTSYFWSDDSDTTEVLVSWDDPDGNYYQIYLESPNTDNMPSLGIFGRRMMQPFKGNTYRVSAREFRSTGYHYIYVYRVNSDYAELYASISSTDLANPVSFIGNAFGIFTAMSVARTRVYVAEDSE